MEDTFLFRLSNIILGSVDVSYCYLKPSKYIETNLYESYLELKFTLVLF